MSARILLVDDEPTNLALLRALLQPFGYELVLAANGLEAVRLFEASPPDLVLLDYVMPGMDGLQVLAHIRSRHTSTHVPAILVTAHADREHRLRGLEAGADDFVEKPIDAAVLMARVRTLLSLKAMHDALARSKRELEERHHAVKQAQREHRELTEFIVHDLKNPLSIVCANLEFAQRQVETPSFALPAPSPFEGDPGAQSNLMGSIHDANVAARRLTTMISDLLTISRMEDSTFSLRREGITVTTLLRAVVQSYVSRARHKNILLAAPPDLDVEIQADRALMMRVFENILDNALRYTPERGHIAVGARTATDVEMSISNDGPSIPATQRLNIFEKFRRGAAEDASRSNAGLGLYFCKRVVEAHGGTIAVVESAEFPTSFRISLPR